MNQNQQHGNITAESKEISDTFIGIINKAFEIIDEVSDKIGDGNYLELANHFKALHEFKNKLSTNTIYVEHERRTHMTIRPNQRRLTLAEKMKKTKKYMKCRRCDTVITKKEKYAHMRREKCKRIYSTKMLTIATKLRVLSDNLVVLDDMLDKRDEYYYILDYDKTKKRKGKIYTLRDYYEDEIKYENAIIKIQSLWRGRKVRKNMEKKEESKYFVKREEAKNIKCKDCLVRNCVILKAEDFEPCSNNSGCDTVVCWNCRLIENLCKCSGLDMLVFWCKNTRSHLKGKKRYEEKRKQKWRDLRCLIKAKKKCDISKWRKSLQEKYDFKVKGVSKMTKDEIVRECVKWLFGVYH
jgi:hypothetical protein